MNPAPDPTTVLPRPTPVTYLVALADEGGAVPPTLGVVRRLVARGHRVVVLGAEALAVEIRAAGAEHRRWDRPGDPLRAAAEDTCRAIGELHPDAVLVAGACLGALVAAERATVPLGLLVAGGAGAPSGHLLPGLNEVRAGHGLEPLRRVADQLARADREVVVATAGPGARPDAVLDAAVDALEALPGCRPWLLVARHAPGAAAAVPAREPQLTA